MPRVLVLLNAAARALEQSSTQDEATRIRQVLEAHQLDTDVRHVTGEELTEVAKSARHEGFDVVLAGGGDGTISAVAAALVGTDMPFGALPLGTLNHFSKDRQTPQDLDEAVGALARGVVAGDMSNLAVTVVNDRPFLLSLAIGFYPQVVKHRDAQRRSRGRGKWTAMLIAMVKTFKRLPLVRLNLRVGDDVMRRTTPLLFICTSPTELNVFGIDDAGCLERGGFNLFVAHRMSRLRLLWLSIRSVCRRLKPARDFQAMCLSDCVIETRRPVVRVALDGEVTDLQSPLHIRVIPTALRVVTPRPQHAMGALPTHAVGSP